MGWFIKCEEEEVHVLVLGLQLGTLDIMTNEVVFGTGDGIFDRLVLVYD